MIEDEYRRMADAEGIHWWYRALHKLVLARVAEEFRRVGPLQILDAGCGTGGLGIQMGRFGEVAGLELESVAIDYCRLRGLSRVKQVDLSTLNEDTPSYDVITIIDVLYHSRIAEPSAVIRALSTRLKPGGLLLMHEVAFQSLYGRHDQAVMTGRRFRKDQLAAIVSANSLHIESIGYRLMWLFPIAWVLRRWSLQHSNASGGPPISDLRMPPLLINRLLLNVAHLDQRLAPSGGWPFGTSVFVVARKPLHPADAQLNATP